MTCSGFGFMQTFPFIIQSWEKKRAHTPPHVLLQIDFSDNLYLKLNKTQHISHGRISAMEMNNSLSIVSILPAC